MYNSTKNQTKQILEFFHKQENFSAAPGICSGAVFLLRHCFFEVAATAFLLMIDVKLLRVNTLCYITHDIYVA